MKEMCQPETPSDVRALLLAAGDQEEIATAQPFAAREEWAKVLLLACRIQEGSIYTVPGLLNAPSGWLLRTSAGRAVPVATSTLALHYPCPAFATQPAIYYNGISRL